MIRNKQEYTQVLAERIRAFPWMELHLYCVHPIIEEMVGEELLEEIAYPQPVNVANLDIGERWELLN